MVLLVGFDVFVLCVTAPTWLFFCLFEFWLLLFGLGCSLLLVLLPPAACDLLHTLRIL